MYYQSLLMQINLEYSNNDQQENKTTFKSFNSFYSFTCILCTSSWCIYYMQYSDATSQLNSWSPAA